jgi:hypothetical protein
MEITSVEEDVQVFRSHWIGFPYHRKLKRFLSAARFSVEATRLGALREIAGGSDTENRTLHPFRRKRSGALKFWRLNSLKRTKHLRNFGLRANSS